MKKAAALTMAVLLMAVFVFGCGKQAEENTQIRLGGLKGATSMGMVKLLDDAAQGKSESDIAFTMAVSADELTPKFLKGELDVLAVPVNLGSILYHNSEKQVQFLAVNTLGLLSIVEKGTQSVRDISDLKGKTIYATGKGATPEYVLRYLLEQNGLDPEKDVTLEWKSEPAEVVSQMAAKERAVAMLPEPFVTVAKSQLADLTVALDLTEVWEALDNGSRFLTAGLIVRKEFAEAHPEQLQTFLQEYKASTEYINANPKEGAALVEAYGIIKAEVAEKAIPHCNITYLDGEEMKTAVEGYLSVLYGQNAKSVGGALPEDDFYYE